MHNHCDSWARISSVSPRTLFCDLHSLPLKVASVQRIISSNSPIFTVYFREPLLLIMTPNSRDVLKQWTLALKWLVNIWITKDGLSELGIHRILDNE